MKNTFYTLLIVLLAVVNLQAQEYRDFIEEAQKQLNTPMNGVIGGPFGAGNGVVGAIGGTVSVGGLGAANYCIPIELPSDIGNMKPSLSITYDSQSSNGLLGWGWTLGGLSAISRTGSNLFLDYEMDGADFDNDNYVLDGQRLCVIDESSNGCEYRTEVDGMSRIISYNEPGVVNGPAKFKVWTADGMIMEYGFDNETTNSRVQWESESDITKKEVGMWLLNRVEDRNGNYMEYHYVVGGHNFYLDRIVYTGNEDLRISPAHTIKFKYNDGTREDEETTFIGNHALHQSKLLKSILVYHLNDEISGYEFSYYGINNGIGDPYNRLKSIKYFAGDVCYNPTEIAWYNSGYNYPTNQLKVNCSTGNGNAFYNRVKYTGDFNGDGYQDVMVIYRVSNKKYAEIYLNNGAYNEVNGTCSFSFLQKLELPTYTVSIHIADLNGDGRDDMATVSKWSYSLLNDKIEVFTYLAKWNSDNQWRLDYTERSWADETILINSGHQANLMAGDFLGNGKTQLIMQIPNVDFFTTPYFLFIEQSDANKFSLNKHYGTVLPGKRFVSGDFNGDGITEIWCDNDDVDSKANSGTDPEKSTNGAVFRLTSINEAQRISNDYMLGSSHNIMLGDFNGDGRLDFLSYRKDGGKYEWKINYFKENALFWDAFDITDELPANDFTNDSYDIFDAPSQHYSYKYIEVNDMDGDGKSDIVVEHNKKLYILYAPIRRLDNGKARFSHVKVYDMRSIGLCQSDGTLYNMSLRCGSFLGKENMGVIGDFNIFSAKPMTDGYSVGCITDGMGNMSIFSYDYLINRNSGFYRWSRENDNQELEIFAKPLAIKALKQVSSYNWTVQMPQVITKYYYRNAMIHRRGKGALGFLTTATSSYMDDTKIDSTICNYSTEPLLAHRTLALQSQVTYNGLNKMVSNNTFVNSYIGYLEDVSGHVYTPVVTKTYSRTYDPDHGEEILLSKSITENDYQIDYIDSSTGLAYYYDFLKLPDVYTGMTSNRWAASVAECPYQTHTHTDYQLETQAMLDNWVINRPESTMVSAWKTDDDQMSKSLIVYKYRDNFSYLPEIVTSYPGGDISNANGLATATTYKYDLAGNVLEDTLSAIDGSLNPRTTSYTYHNYRFPESETNAIGYTSKSNYNQQYGEIMWSKDCNNQVTFYNYSDHLGSSSWVQYPDHTYGCTALRWAYDENGHLVPDAPSRASYYSWKRISGDAPVQVFFDAAGRELRTVTIGLNGKVIYQDTDYNSMGLVFKKSLPYFKENTPIWTTYFYDGLLRPIYTYLPDGTYTTTKYDGLTTVSLFTDNYGHVRETSQTNNYLGQVTKSVDAMGTEVNYHYYHDGKLRYTQIGNDEDTRITLEYDDAGNRTILFDPNYGKVVDTYDAFGQLRSTTTPKGDVTQCHYDDLGRMDWRLENDHQATTTTRTTWTYNEAEGQKGLLARIQYDDVQSISFCYDASHLNRLASKTETLNSNEYTTLYTYDDACGFPLRVRSVTYPTKYTIQNEYEAGTGILCRINDVNGKMLWQANLTNALGQITESLMGNGVTNKRGYSPQTGRLESIKSFSGQQILQDLLYGYDDFGNLAARTDNQKGLTEEFKYDELDRLETTFLNGEMTGLMAYDSYGRIRRKEADGNLVFDATGQGCYRSDKPHAIRQAELEGNPFPSEQLDMTYTMFDKVSTIRQGRGRAIFAYGYNHERISMEEFNDNGWKRTKTYVGGCEYYDDPNGKHSLTHLVGPTGVFAVAEQIGDGNSFNLHYIHKDHLGSWVAQTDEWGNLEEESSYDAWGNRRDPYTWTGSVAQLPMFDRGFTGHEHLWDFGLINMNGRMYDPVMSSFLSVDNYVQSPDNSQNFNRYAYCLNNPLKYTDPSGELCFAAVVAIGAAVSVACQMTSNAIHEQAIFKGVGRAAITGALQGAFSYGIGQVAEVIGSVAGEICKASFQVVAHGTLGGCSTYARGGEFGVGFASGAVSSAISSITVGICGVAKVSEAWTKRVLVAAGGLSGGAASKIAGGDFWDGVCNGLISSGLNHALHLVAEGVLPDDPPTEKEIKERVKTLIQAKAALGLSFSSKMLFDEKTGEWMGKNGKIYSMKWGGNRYTGGKNSYARKNSNILKGANTALTIFQVGETVYDRIDGSISTGDMLRELGFTLGTAVTGEIGAAIGVAKAASELIIHCEKYQEFKFNVNYSIMEKQYGSPNENNQQIWMDFINNYK